MQSHEVVPINVLIVDDEPDTVSTQALLLQQRGASVQIVTPDEVTRQQLVDAQVVLVDYELKPWQEEAGSAYDGKQAIGRISTDGLALATVLRRHVQQEESPPTAFVIFTAQLTKLANPLPHEYRNHALAHINNLEWVFEKIDPSRALVQQILSLGHAIQQLPKRWPNTSDDYSLRQLLNLLNANVDLDNGSSVSLIEDVTRCLPPIHELSEWSHGLVVLRWMLHRILPYPCFLLDSQYLAARLPVEHSALQTELNDKGSPLSVQLAECSYTGILNDFDKPRWWRSKCERWLWKHLRGDASDPDTLLDFTRRMAGIELPPSDPPQYPVVCVDENYQALPGFTSMSDAVRLQPDDWPSYADSAWGSMERLENSPKLRSIVVEADKERLEL